MRANANSVNVRKAMSDGTPSIDPAAQAYITAAGITDATEIAAVERLFLDLKGTGSTTNNSNIYSKFYTLYPISPTSLSAAAVNAVNPATYDMTWYNSPTHTATGVSGNAASMYGDTNFNPATHATSGINNFGLTIDAATNVGSASTIDIGSTGYFQINITHGTYTYIVGDISSNISGTLSTIGVRTVVRRGASDMEAYLNGSSDGTNTTLGGSFGSNTLYFMGRHDAGLAFPTARRYRFSAIHEGLTDTEAQDLYDAITTYNANVIEGGR